MHDTLTIGIPVFAILAGILVNRSDLQDLRSERKRKMKELRGDIRNLRENVTRRFDAVDAELRYGHGTTGRLEGRIQSLEGK